MGIEWFRDLSIIIFCLVSTVTLIFVAIIIFRLYRKMAVTLSLVQTLIKSVTDTVNKIEEIITTTSQNINDTVKEVKDSINLVSKSIADSIYHVREGINQALSMCSVIGGIQKGFEYIKNMFSEKCKEEGEANE